VAGAKRSGGGLDYVAVIVVAQADDLGAKDDLAAGLLD
jgi:hypothetical protein